jgi:hypothetical protein
MQHNMQESMQAPNQMQMQQPEQMQSPNQMQMQQPEQMQMQSPNQNQMQQQNQMQMDGSQKFQMPKIVEVEGVLEEVKDQDCPKNMCRESTTTLIMLKTKDGKMVKLHLGPTSLTKPMVEKLKKGSQLKAKAFQVPRMAQDEMIVQEISQDGTVVLFRDEMLIPVWAKGQSRRPPPPGSAPQQ